MRMLRWISLPVLLLFALTSVSCVFSVGGGKDERVERATVGSELVDLKQALENGAITQEEYDKAKKELLDSTQRR